MIGRVLEALEENIHQEGILAKGIRVDHNATIVTDDFEPETSDHATEETPGLVTNGQADLTDKDQGKDCCHKDIG